MNIRLIHNDTDYEDILREIDRFFEANVQPGTPEGIMTLPISIFLLKNQFDQLQYLFPRQLRLICGVFPL